MTLSASTLSTVGRQVQSKRTIAEADSTLQHCSKCSVDSLPR